MTPARLRALADRYGQPGILRACLDDTGEAYRRTDFAGFLNLYKQVTLLLRSAADFHAVGLDLGAQLAADGVLYAEVTVSYGVLQRRGLDPLPIQRALHEAAAQIEAEYGVTMRWIGDAVRQWGVDVAWRAFEAAAHAGRALGIVGFGLGGDETAAAPEPFAPLFADVQTEGFGVTIHAGEAAGPESARSRPGADLEAPRPGTFRSIHEHRLHTYGPAPERARGGVDDAVEAACPGIGDGLAVDHHLAGRLGDLEPALPGQPIRPATAAPILPESPHPIRPIRSDAVAASRSPRDER